MDTRALPSWWRLVAGTDSRRPKRGYDYGLSPPGRTDDGYTIRFCGPRNPQLLAARRKVYGGAARRLADHQIRPAGNSWDLGRHPADRGCEERRKSTAYAGLEILGERPQAGIRCNDCS